MKSQVANDEFHRASPAVPLYSRVSPGLANNITSGRQKVAQEKKCRICPQKYGLTRHHLVPHSWFLSRRAELRSVRNANANIVPLCAECHRLVDGTRDPVERLQKRAALRGALYTNEVAFILQVMGRGWFDQEYPRDP